MTTHLERTQEFHAMHVPGVPIVLPNVWDAASARVVLAAGARAIATTSAGVAWSRGQRDGNELTGDGAIDSLRRIVAAVNVPVSVDIERGYGETASDVAATISSVLEMGVSGVNIEDSLMPMAQQEQRISAARAAAENAGIPLFINARIDTHRLGEPGGDDWMAETLSRAAVYANAGASGIFVLGGLSAATVRALVGATTLPVNVAFGPGTLSIGELARAGASRVSAGSAIAEAAYSVAHDWASTMFSAPESVAPSSPALGWAALNQVVRD